MKNVLNNIGYPIFGLVFCFICWFSPSIASCIKVQYFDFEKFTQLEDYRVFLICASIVFSLWILILLIIKYVGKNRPCLIKISDDTFGCKLEYKSKLGFAKEIEYNTKSDVENKRSLNDTLENIKTTYYNNKDFKDYKNIIVFAIARTPFVFLIGYLYRDTGRKYNYVHNFREHDSCYKGLKILKKNEINNIELKHNYIENTKNNDLVVIVSTSYNIDTKFDSYFQDMSKLIIETSKKSVDVINSVEMIDKFSSQICDLIREHSNKFKKIHLFICSSTSLTFNLGTKLGKNYDPEIFVYDYNRMLPIRRNWAIQIDSCNNQYDINMVD